jgi:hypothetical protein
MGDTRSRRRGRENRAKKENPEEHFLVSEEEYPNERLESSKTLRKLVDLRWTSATDIGSRCYEKSLKRYFGADLSRVF